MKLGDKYLMEFIVDEKVYNGFMDIFKDRNPLHIDDTFARQKGFKSKVMQGNILNGFLSYFIGEGLHRKDVMILSQQINFTKPVYLNDKVFLHAEITNVIDAVNMAEIKFHFLNMDTVKVARGSLQIKIN